MSWWWAIQKYGGTCEVCRERVPAGTAMAYFHARHADDRRALCEMCADSEGVAAECRASKKFAKAQR